MHINYRVKDEFVVESQRLRRQILTGLNPYECPGPPSAGTVYVWPTKYCPVQCAHCNFASPLPGRGRSNSDSFHSANAQSRLVEFVNQLGIWKAVISGGGEPFLELKTVERLVQEVQSERLDEIEVITSGFWGRTPKSAQRILACLADAYRRRSKSDNVKLLLRLSVDWFHRQSIGLEPIENIIRAWDTGGFTELGCYIRSVLMTGDSTIRDLAASLDADLGPIVDYQQDLVLRSGRRVLVYYKNLIIDGRLSPSSLVSLPVALSPMASAAQFSNRFRDASGRLIPALTYTGPVVRHLDGVSLIVEYDGGIKILEATAPDNVPSIYEHDWPSARARLYSDPLTIYLLEDGPEALARLMHEIRADSMQIATDTNQLYYIVDKLLQTPEARLWATVKILLVHRERGRQAFDDRLLQDALRYLDVRTPV